MLATSPTGSLIVVRMNKKFLTDDSTTWNRRSFSFFCDYNTLEQEKNINISFEKKNIVKLSWICFLFLAENVVDKE